MKPNLMISRTQTVAAHFKPLKKSVINFPNEEHIVIIAEIYEQSGRIANIHQNFRNSLRSSRDTFSPVLQALRTPELISSATIFGGKWSEIELEYEFPGVAGAA